MNKERNYVASPRSYPGQRESGRLRRLHADLAQAEWAEFRKDLALDHLSIIQFCSRAARKYIKSCQEFYRAQTEAGPDGD
jgi:hypothetical protein